MAYSKLHSSIINSSLWVERDSTRLLFITLLAMCDKDGMVYGSRGGLARVANIEPDEIDEAWNSLMSPDADSSDKHRAPENEGRRVEEVSGGFRLLNFEYYRGLRNEDDRREQNRIAQAKFKAKKVSHDKPSSATISHGKPRKAHTETDTEAETEAEKKKGASRTFDAAAIDMPEWLKLEDWRRWCSDRAARKKPITEEGAKSQLRKLDEFRQQGHSPSSVIDHSIAGGYQGLFAPAKGGGSKQTALEARNRAVIDEYMRENHDPN